METPSRGTDFRALFEADPRPALVMQTGSDFIIVAMTDAYLRATMTTRDGLLGRAFFDAFPDNPDDPGATGLRDLRASLERVVIARAPDRMDVQRYDIRRPPAEGGGFEERHWCPLNTPVFSIDGRVTSIIHSVEDVTESLRLQQQGVQKRLIAQALREGKEWFTTTLNSIADAVVTTDLRSGIIFMNPEAESLTGWTLEAAAGRPLGEVLQFLSRESGAAIEDRGVKVIREETPASLPENTLLRTRAGTTLPVEDIASPIRDVRGAIVGSVVVFRDVTERARIEDERTRAVEALTATNTRLRLAQRAARAGIWDWDLEDDRFLWTDECYDVYGLDPSQTRPSYESWFASVHEADRERVDREARRGLERGGELVLEYRIRHPRRGIRWLAAIGETIRAADGRPLHMTGITLDITERKVAEDALQQNDRRKDEFLAMLAHELRNPLAAISNAVAMTARSRIPEDIDRSMEIIRRQMKHLCRLTDDLLDVSRITRGKIQLRKELVDAAPILSGAVEMVRPLVQKRKHELTVSLAAGHLRLEADPVRLEQILVNLLTNAAKYTDPGGRIELVAGLEDQEVVFRVRDNGVGMRPEVLPRMFELFTQGDRALARSEGGLGIGLTLVRGLAEMHRGTVTATSEGPGRGSEFVVRLPAADVAAATSPAPPAPPLRAVEEGSRVLVVDDDGDNVHGMALVLKLLGHDVRVAYSGPEALAAVRQQRPEVVLLDIGLPGMDGYEVAARLRQEESGRDVLIIAVSGYGRDEDRRRSKEAGFDHHLVKPIDIDALAPLLHRRTAVT
jgi:PAS domain S-box-containing protein